MDRDRGELAGAGRKILTRRRVVGAALAIGWLSVAPGVDAKAARGGTKSGQQLAKTGLKFRGTPYVMGGHSPRGFDCSGLTQYVVKKVIGTDIGPSVPGQWQFGAPVASGKWRPGDLVFFENTFERGLSHVGIYVGNGRFVHAQNEETGVLISELASDYYTSHYAGARRLT